MNGKPKKRTVDPAASPLALMAAVHAAPAELLAEWSGSPEAQRVERLGMQDPALYGGETRLLAAINSTVAEFVERMRIAAVRGRELTEAELAAREGAKKTPAPAAPAGYGYRACSACRGSLKEGRGVPCRCIRYSAFPGFELFALPPVIAR